MKKQRCRCKHCKCLLEPCPRVSKHDYCNKKECQRARKRDWQKKKMAENEVYCNDQKDAQSLWRENNPDYWKEYRGKNPEYTKRNREKQRERNRSRRAKAGRKPDCQPVAKMDASIAKMDAIGHETAAFSGRYRLVPLAGQEIAKMDAIIVEISAISSG
jgi:hypothetical protein